MFTNRRKKIEQKLLQLFGKIKDESFDFESIESYFRKNNHSAAFQVLTDKTCKDLDFHEFFMFVDRTTSAPGQQYLFYRLRNIPDNQSNNEYTEKLIDRFMQDQEFRIKLQTELFKLKDKESYYLPSLFQEKHINQPKWLFITRILSLSSLLSLLFLVIKPFFVFILFVIFIINFGIHYWNKRNLAQYIVTLPQLLKLKAVATELYKDDQLRLVDPDLNTPISILEKISREMTFFKLEARLQGDAEAVAWGILELFKILFLFEPILLFRVLRKLDNQRKEIERIFVFVGQIDVLLSIASLRKGLEKYCIPEICNESKYLRADEMYHPLIANCVENSIEVNKSSVLLTGSNMSGKTSFIRTIGLNVISGLTLNTCFAEQFILPRIRIFSAIRISDDLLNNKSFYFEEVLTIKNMINNSLTDIPNLFLLDEIFKGTNTIERIAAGKAVLSALSSSNNLVFVSTHDIELADLLKSEYELYHFSEKINQQNVDFDYKLKEGKLKNRNAIRILQINDYPKSIIKEALELAGQIDNKMGLKALFH